MIAVLLALALQARAVEVRTDDAACPTGVGQVHIHHKLASDALGGYDSDLADYSSNGQWRTYAIATCAEDYYSVYAEDARAAIPADKRAAVTAALTAARAGLADPKNPTVWERYGLAVATYTALGKDPAFLAQLWVEASWTVRDAAVGYIPALSGPDTARAYLDAGWTELKKPLATADRKKVLFNLARIAERGGWADERDAFLAAYEAAGPMSAEESTGIRRFRHLTAEVEPAIQDKAIAALGAALKSALPPTQHITLSYTLADLLRRRGREREALPLYFVIADDKTAPEDLRRLAIGLARTIADRLDPKP